MTDAHRVRGTARLAFAVVWCGPWEYLEAWLLGIDPGALDLRRVVPDGSLRERLAARAGSRDVAWQCRHVDSGTTPHGRWRRRLTPRPGVFQASVSRTLWREFRAHWAPSAVAARMRAFADRVDAAGNVWNDEPGQEDRHA